MSLYQKVSEIVKSWNLSEDLAAVAAATAAIAVAVAISAANAAQLRAAA